MTWSPTLRLKAELVLCKSSFGKKKKNSSCRNNVSVISERENSLDCASWVEKGQNVDVHFTVDLPNAADVSFSVPLLCTSAKTKSHFFHLSHPGMLILLWLFRSRWKTLIEKKKENWIDIRLFFFSFFPVTMVRAWRGCGIHLQSFDMTWIKLCTDAPSNLFLYPSVFETNQSIHMYFNKQCTWIKELYFYHVAVRIM